MLLHNFLNLLQNSVNGAAIISHPSVQRSNSDVTAILSTWFQKEDRDASVFAHADLSIIEPEVSKTTISIAQVRHTLSNFQKHAHTGSRRALWVPHADQMTRTCQNALLKPIEEPPVGAYIFLSCAHPYQLIPTIRSRCIQVSTHDGEDLGEVEQPPRFLLDQSPTGWLSWKDFKGDKNELLLHTTRALNDEKLTREQRAKLTALQVSLSGFEPLKVIVERELFQ